MQEKLMRQIVLGVGGGIAAYKACDLVRRLRDADCAVRVVLTASAQAFVAPLSFQALSGYPVRSALLDPEAESGMDHIALARWADAVVIAPATADLMARLAHGLADDLLTTLCLATEAPLFLAPAMNRVMWAHPATQANAATLAARGVRLLGPAEGSQACGETGAGRMLEPNAIADAVVAALLAETAPAAMTSEHRLRVLLTAGPTYEPIDPVRFIGNRSSGQMGFALAAAAQRAGAEVVLVHGPVALPVPPGVDVVAVETALEMHDAVLARVANCDIFISAAAVADYRPVTPAGQKIKKQAATMQLDLVRNPDIVAAVAARESERPFVVGFAAETEDLRGHALEKLARKNLDMIAANDVSAGQAIGRKENALTLYWSGGELRLPLQDKTTLAEILFAHIIKRYVEVARNPSKP